MNVYLAAPIVGVDEDIKSEKQYIKDVLEACKLTVYDPSAPGNGTPNSWGMSMDEWARSIFSLDVRALDRCDWVVCLDYGRNCTAGTAWEVGYAFGIGKKILIIEMDNDQHYSVMMRGCSANYCKLKDFVNTPTSEVTNKWFVERGRVGSNVTVCD